MSDEKQLYMYQINIADATHFSGCRIETIYAYAHALSDQLLTLSTANGGRIHFNWSLVQSFKSAPLKEASDE
jgi:hypothetical protein